MTDENDRLAKVWLELHAGGSSAQIDCSDQPDPPAGVARARLVACAPAMWRLLAKEWFHLDRDGDPVCVAQCGGSLQWSPPRFDAEAFDHSMSVNKGRG